MNSRTIEHVEFLYEDSGRRLVVFSHGTGSTPRAMRGLAEHLVSRGWIAAMIEHPGNNRNDDRLANTIEILEQRPRDVKRAIDAAASAFDIAPGAAVIGHSLGGYTALAVAGGVPWSLPNQGTPRALDVVHDPRVRAVVLLAPAIPWFMPAGSLATVHAKVMVRAGERDEMAPPAFIETVLRDLPKDYAVVPSGGHFAFFWPVPPHLVKLPPGQDPPGFDRAAYQPQLCAEVTAFLEAEIEADDRR